MKKLFCLLMALLMLIPLSSCKGDKAPSKNTSDSSINNSSVKSELRLLYSASDSFNPYTAETDLNRKLCLLLFDSLVRINNNFEAEKLLAQNIVTEGNVCTVTLKDSVFSDGSPVTADDIVYSYGLAKSSQTDYAYQLYEVQSVRAADSKTVIFSLTRSDPFFERLIDFPILKSGSDKSTDTDGRLITPIGSGRYIVNPEQNGLIANKSHSSEKVKIEKIKLINAPDAEAVSHYVEIGATDIYYTDAADTSIVRMSGKKSTVNLNRLVYIGVNHSYGPLSSARLRHAISSALDRSAVCKEAYHNNAVAATGFFNPAIKLVESVQNLQITANSQISIENLEEIGYNRLDSNNKRVNSSGNRLSLTLLVNSENSSRVNAARLIAEQLSAVGIEITVLERSFEQYTQALQSGNFQLYLGEIKTLANMDLSPLTTVGGSCAFGITEPKSDGEEAPKSTVSEVIGGFYGGKNGITDVAVALQTELPVIPVCFRQGLLFHNEALRGIGEASQGDIYFSIGQYTIKK